MDRNCALGYARSANQYGMDVDAVFIETDSSCRNSKRRLAILRSAYELGVSQYQIAYVTNAINELVFTSRQRSDDMRKADMERREFLTGMGWMLGAAPGRVTA